MALIAILTTEEKKTFDAPPVFTNIERKKYLGYFPNAITAIADDLRTSTTKVCFLTAYGYFKATNKFFNKQFNPSDLAFVARRLLPLLFTNITNCKMVSLIHWCK